MSTTARSCLILYMVHVGVTLHYPHLGNGICNLKGGFCLPSNASICNPLDAECDEGNICCEAATAVPIKVKAAGPIAKQAAAFCSSQTQELNDESGSISLWNEHNNYEHNLDCQWQITVDVDNFILIEWVKFDIENSLTCGWDYVEILGQKFCGDGMPDSLSSPSNQVLVKFHSDFSVSKRGFSLTYSSVRTSSDTCSSETQDLRGKSGSISLWSENNYAHNLDCQWQITVDTGNFVLIHWIKFDIENSFTCFWDYVEILGQKFCGDDMPDSLISSSNQVLVKFHSDFSVSKRGFSLTYSSARTSSDTCSSETQVLYGDYGSIYLWSENNYENNLDCEWQITVDAGNFIFIEWIKFDIEHSFPCAWDYVEIFGKKFCGDDMPDSLSSTSNQVLVKFHSDYSFSKKGFFLRYSSVSSACGIVNSQLKIVGGEETLLHEYPWQVSLVPDDRTRPFCGGSIVSPRWILTAAHCLNGMTTSDMKVIVGEHDWTTTTETINTYLLHIQELVMHPAYNSRTRDSDIALIKLTSELTFSQANGIAPVCLPPVTSHDQFENVDATVSGWGLLSTNGEKPDVLHDVTVPTMSNTQCQLHWGHQILDNMICTGEPGSNKGPYQGDSGGPLVTEANGHMIQIGVVNFGSRDLILGMPQVYARVSSHMTWILSYLDDDA